VVEENITKCEIGFPALSAYRFPLFQCVKYIRRAGEGLNALLKEQLWIAANVITSCRRKRWYRSDLSMYYTAAAGETGAIYDPLADESATSRPPPPPPGGTAIISFAWFFVLKWISGADPKIGKSTAQLEGLNKNPS
jgi:hypothetical protein